MSLIYKYTYLCKCGCGHSGSSDSPPSTAAYQQPSCSLEHGQSQRGSLGCDCPTWLWVMLQEATMLAKPGPSCGYCKSSVGTCPWLGFQPDGGVDSAQGCGVCPRHQTRTERVMLSHEGVPEPWRHAQSPGWTLMLRCGCLAGNPPVQHLRGEQSRITQCSASPAQPEATQLLGSTGE